MKVKMLGTNAKQRSNRNDNNRNFCTDRVDWLRVDFHCRVIFTCERA